MSPRPQIDHIRKPQLLAAAAEVIAERGFAATRISDVAERAGTSSPAVLYWFGSKEELLSEALTWEEERFYAELTGRLAERLSPSERLALLIEASSVGGGWTLWMELWSRALRDPGVAEARGTLDARWRGILAQIIEEGEAAGEFAPRDSDEVAWTLAALLDGLAVQVTLNDPEMPPQRMTAIARRVAEAELGTALPEAPQVESSDETKVVVA
jgi:AcrR family transcriptional regulator